MNTLSKNMTAVVALGAICGCLTLTSTAQAQKIVTLNRPVTYRVLPTASLLPTRIVPVVPYTTSFYTPSLYTPSVYSPIYPVTTLPTPIRSYSVYSRLNPYDFWSYQGSYASYASALQVVATLQYNGVEAYIR